MGILCLKLVIFQVIGRIQLVAFDSRNMKNTISTCSINIDKTPLHEFSDELSRTALLHRHVLEAASTPTLMFLLAVCQAPD